MAERILTVGVLPGSWSSDKKGKVAIAPLAPLPRAARREVEDEAARLAAWWR